MKGTKTHTPGPPPSREARTVVQIHRRQGGRESTITLVWPKGTPVRITCGRSPKVAA
jgi:hypothetical protein